MKTIGERIRQARQAKGWSGEELATRCGYKSQSGISNLENRATGSGGNKIARIAQELRVPIDWLINGPDTDVVPFIPGDQVDRTLEYLFTVESPSTHKVAERPAQYVAQLPIPGANEKTVELVKLFDMLDAAGKAECLGMVRGFVAGRRPHTHGQDPRLARR